MIKYIDVSKLHPHPNNPRKDLGDLTELTDSISAQGILQNLTVVPFIEGIDPDKYTVVIGHRRLEAAKLADLEEVPCVIADLDYKEQLATMLMENIQRSDLTIYEQSQGFQQLLDFDYSVDDIAGMTGFSKTTVRKRVKLLELDQEKFQQSIQRGANLQDYAELNKIESIVARNRVLETIGTNDFKWRLASALEEQEMPQRKKELLEFLKDWAKPAKKPPSNSAYEYGFHRYKLDKFKKPKDADNTDYYYVDNDFSITLYRKTDAPSEAKKPSEAEKTFKKRESQIKDLTKRAYRLRANFIKEFTGEKKKIEAIMAFVMIRLIRYGSADLDVFLELLEIDAPEVDGRSYAEVWALSRELIFKKFLEQPERVILLTAWSSLDNGSEKYYRAQSYNSTIAHDPNPTLDAIYDGLVMLGYAMSDEEQQLRDGTHEIFTKKEE